MKLAPPRLKASPGRLALPAKRADPELLTTAYAAWRQAVMERAGWRCEAVERGIRCQRSAPKSRMYADHIIERRDGGALLNLSNGQCLCNSHHVSKTIAERAKRLRH